MAFRYPPPESVRPCRFCGKPIITLRWPPKKDAPGKWGAFEAHDPLPLAETGPAYFNRIPHIASYATKVTIPLGNHAKEIPLAIPHLCSPE